MLSLLPLVLWAGPPAIAVMPRAGNPDTSVAFYDVVTLNLISRVPDAGTDIVQILPLPDGSRQFLISRNGSASIVRLDKDYGNPTAIGGRLSVAPVAAAMQPNGARLAVLSDRLFLLDTSNDQISPADGIAVPGTPIDLAVTLDSSRVFVLSQLPDGKIQVSAVDGDRISSTLTLPGEINSPPSALFMAPNGRLYVFANLRIYEVDAVSNRLTNRGEIVITGYAGKGAAASPDGRYILVPNARPAQGNTHLFQLDTWNKTAFPSPIVSGQDAFERLQPYRTIIGTELMIGLTRSGRLFDIRFGNPTPSIQPAAADAYFTEGPVARPSYASVAFSNEFFPRKMAVIKNDGEQTALFSVDLLDQRLARTALPNLPWRAALVTPSASAGTLRMLQINGSQIVAAGAQSPLPLVVRVVEPEGRGVFRAPVTFATSAPGVTIQNSVVLAGAEGYAQTYLIAGDTPGPFTVTANTPGAPPLTFTLTVPSTPNGADRSGLFVYAGNGQVVRELTRSASPLVAQLRDLNGNPVAGAAVRWTIKRGPGGISGGGVTDANGLTRATFTGDLVTSSTSYTQTLIEASTANSRVSFYASTTPSAIPSRGIAPDPVVTVLYPELEQGRTFQGPAGGLIRNAIGIRVTNAVGPETGLGLPNVGIRGSIVEGTVTAECNTEALTDSTGFLACDLLLGPRTGQGTLRFNVGEFRDLPNTTLVVTLGGPSRVLIVTGNGQSASVNQSLPTPLTARVTDAGGNVLSNVTVRWTVTRGEATLAATTSVTDSNGNTSIRAALGAVPGPVTVRASVDPEVFAQFTLTATVTYSGIQLVSGDAQSALTGAQFAEPLVVQVRDAANVPVPGVNVRYTVDQGNAVLAAATATTDRSGIARMLVTAGPEPGASRITASIDRFSTVFQVQTRPRAPLVDRTGFRNAFSDEAGLVPCGLARLRGLFLTESVAGSMVAANPGEPLPVSFGPVEGLLINGVAAGIASLSNFSGEQSIVFQTPCETLPDAPALVEVRIAGLNPVRVTDVPVTARQPAILTVTPPDAEGRRLAIEGAVKRGARVQLLATGLGQTQPALQSLVPGVSEGQVVTAEVICGVNDVGAVVTRAFYAPGSTGVYVVEIEIPAAATPGLYRPVVIALSPGPGLDLLYSPPAYLHIE